MSLSRTAFALVLGLLALPGAGHAAEIEVKMLNLGAKGPMVFEPDFVRAAPGDTVVFVPTDAGHNAESVPGMLPEGVPPFKSGFNKEYRLTVEKPGVYGIKCTPHYGMGMVALVAVGEPVNLEAAKAVKHPGRAGQVFQQLLAEAASGS
ncbi:pseudoazurin [Aureimonas sp. AU4]|uniref:pseudoazurin n=1 Tax=Aureimonas sp. AU4 TaxID=1638163 RepID=UPI0007809D0A|nr:pseudoazurin [Aureimonas sp. AU4]